MDDEYTLKNFLFDLILGCMTGGLWWIYRFFKILTKKDD